MSIISKLSRVLHAAGLLLKKKGHLMFFPLPFVLALGMVLAVPAVADTLVTKLSLSAPSQLEMGQFATLTATLTTQDGRPVSKGKVSFYSSVTFQSTGGLMEVGEAITNDQGVATFDYIPRRSGENDIMAEYQGDNSHTASRATTKFDVQGSLQFYDSQAGIKVPYINKYLLVGFVGTVWAIILFVVTFVIRIALAPSDEGEEKALRR